MAAKNGKTPNQVINAPCRAGAPLFPLLFPIGSHTISQFQPPIGASQLKTHSPFRGFQLDSPQLSPKSFFRKGGFSAYEKKSLARLRAMETNKAEKPFNIGPLRVDGVMVQQKHPAHFVKKPRRLDLLWARHWGSPRKPQWAFDNGHRAKLPEYRSNINLSGQEVMLVNV